MVGGLQIESLRESLMTWSSKAWQGNRKLGRGEACFCIGAIRLGTSLSKMANVRDVLALGASLSSDFELKTRKKAIGIHKVG